MFETDEFNEDDYTSFNNIDDESKERLYTLEEMKKAYEQGKSDGFTASMLEENIDNFDEFLKTLS